MVTLEDLNNSYRSKSGIIKKRLSEFSRVISDRDDKKIFEEMVFCILTAGTSAQLCLDVIKKVRDIIHTGNKEEIIAGLKSCYRFYNIRAEYIFSTREYLKAECDLRLGELVLSFEDPVYRRDFFALNKRIKGLGFKESSHFLRNIGFKGYAILDKHIINSLYELKVLNENRTPAGRSKYLEIEDKFINFARTNGFDPDELDLLIWSEKTGTILK